MTAAQESRKKEVERLFFVPQVRFKILRHEFREWTYQKLSDVPETRVINYDILLKTRSSHEILRTALENHI